MKLNRNLQLKFFHILIFTFFILSFYQSGSILVINGTKKDSMSNLKNMITSSQSLPLLNKNIPDTISKKIFVTEQFEEDTYVIHSGKYLDGYNIFQFRDFNNPLYTFRITDMDGNIIDEFPSQNNYGYAQPINSTTFLLVSSAPSYFWNRETGKNFSLPFGSHHDISYNPQTKTFMRLSMDYIVDGANTYKYDVISEVNILGDTLWELHTKTFIPFSWWSGEMMGGNRDITHSNTVFWDIEEDMIYLNCRNLNTFFKIDHTTGEVIWALGEHGNFTLFDQRSNQRQNLFYHAHALEKVDNNTFILFDNDYLNQSDTSNHRSRILEITINETTMTANTSWAWAGTGEYYSAYWGDADRLPNGNRFGTFGTETHDSTDIGPRLVEVSESGQIVWEIYYKGGSIGIFKADRFRLSPILNSPEDKMIKTGDPFTLSWLTWYNFRTKLKMNGSYILYHNGQVIRDGDVVFNQFWRPTNLAFDLSSLEFGEHNFTLVVSDEGDHATKDTIAVTASHILVDRDGPSQIEHGQEDGKIQWNINSIPPLTVEIYDNNTLLDTLTWNGSKIELDLNSLPLGSHNISFLIFNGVEKQYCEEFWVTVHSSSPPVVISKPDDLWIWSNQTSVPLKWKVYDLTPWNFTVFVNDFLMESKPWDGSDIIFIFNSIYIGEFLVTLIVFDILGNGVEDNVLINIRAPSTSTTILNPSSTSMSTSTKVYYSIIGFFLGLGAILAKKKGGKQ